MPPKPKQVFLVMAGYAPIGVFKDGPAAEEFTASLNTPPSSIVHTVQPVRFYEYSVGKPKAEREAE